MVPSKKNVVFTLKTKTNKTKTKDNLGRTECQSKNIPLTLLLKCRNFAVTWGVCLLIPHLLHNSQLTRNMSCFYI